MAKKLKHLSENDAVEWQNGEIVILVFEEMIFESSFYEEKQVCWKKFFWRMKWNESFWPEMLSRPKNHFNGNFQPIFFLEK